MSDRVRITSADLQEIWESVAEGMEWECEGCRRTIPAALLVPLHKCDPVHDMYVRVARSLIARGDLKREDFFREFSGTR